MSWNRRKWLGMAGVLLIEPGCTLGARPEPRLLRSELSPPKPFEVPLPLAPVLTPVRSDSTGDYYELETRPADARMLPGITTPIWGYNGSFPGPTIEARRGRRVSVQLRNALPVPVVPHLHGGRTPPDSDGYPMDMLMPGSVREYIYPNEQRAATLWYHDHRMDFTGAQVWRGLAGFYILRDEEEIRLPLPRGEKEIALAICDRSFTKDGALHYPSIDPALKAPAGVTHDYMGGVMGDVILVNGAPWPRLEVANTRYRFRILNASNARRYELALDPVPAGGPVFLQIGSDGGLLAAPIRRRTIRISQAERFDVIVDFSRYPAGTVVTMKNLEDEGPAGEIMQFRVTRTEKDGSVIPATLATLDFPDASKVTVTRVFDFAWNRGLMAWTINGKAFDATRMDAQPKLGATEIWQLKSDFSHPLHLHLVHFQVLSHSGRPGPYDAGWKDTVALTAGETANILVHFSGYRGRYVFHCHNLEHEDMAMMANFEVV